MFIILNHHPHYSYYRDVCHSTSHGLQTQQHHRVAAISIVLKLLHRSLPTFVGDKWDVKQNTPKKTPILTKRHLYNI